MKRMISVAMILIATSVSASTFEACEGVADDVVQAFKVKKNGGDYPQMYEDSLERHGNANYAMMVSKFADEYPSDYRYYIVRDEITKQCMAAAKEK